MNAWHLVARCRPPHRPLLDDPVAALWLWERMRDCFPGALAAVIMPNHLHVVFVSEAPEADAAGFAMTLGHWQRHFGEPGFGWEPIPPPEPVRGRAKVHRNMRYVWLNPCRAGLCDDPVEWAMSSYRDALGAVAEPWCDEALLRSVGAWSWRSDERERLHAWVSGDPSVAIAGTPAPVRAVRGEVASFPLFELARAVAVALRGLPGDVRRPGPARGLFVHLCSLHGWRDAAAVAAACNTSLRTVQRLRHARPDLQALSAAELCLGDERLRRFGGLTLQGDWPQSGRRRPRRASAQPRTTRGSWLERLGVRRRS